MRNINLQGERWRKVPVDFTEAAIVDICFRLADDSRVVLFSNGIATKIRRDDSLEWSTNVNQVCSEPDSTDSSWFNLTAIDAGSMLVALNSHNGAIVTLNPSTGDAELVGEFENGIHAGAWSPDAEILLLVTLTAAEDEEADDNEQQELRTVLLSMNAQFEVLEEVSVDNHLYNHKDAEQAQHNYSVSIAWRPDSMLVAVSSVDATDQMRKVRIYERETLQLHAIGRTEDASGKLVPNLCAPLAWAGVGCSQVLSSIQRKGTKTQQVAFFEPNGLRHREFPLRNEPAAATVLRLCWNSCSDLLLISLRGETSDKVQLWHRSNYHWYLKKEFLFADRRVAHTKFCRDRPYSLAISFEPTALFVEYDLRWDSATIDYSSSDCIAYVVDGHSLNATPLGVAILPPPMYASTLKFEHSIAQVIPSRNKDSQYLGLVLLNNGSVAVLGHVTGEKDGRGFRPPLIIAVSEPDPVLQSVRHCCIVEERLSSMSFIAATATHTEGTNECIIRVNVTVTEAGFINLDASTSTVTDGQILAIAPWVDTASGALMELGDGRLFEYGTSGLVSILAEQLLEPCPWISGLRVILKNDTGHGDDNTPLAVGMSSKGRLYCHDVLLSESASSFCLSTHHMFLCYASSGSQCQLRFLSFEELSNFDPLSGSDENALLLGFEPRNVERGARIVAVIPNRPMMVLQMPRGNLEGVYPRAIVLRYVIQCIAKKDFKRAFAMMRTQKVDLNMIVDLHPQDFLEGEGVAEFLSQVGEIDNLNLFISNLGNYDSTRGRFMIPDWLRDQSNASQHDSFDVSGKVTTCCRRMRLLMTTAEQSGKTVKGDLINRGHYLLPILSTFAKEDPPKLSDALILIKEHSLSLTNGLASSKPPLFEDSAQSAIQYLAFLADYELLFNTALGMYDFDMARAVARNSQMDPKIYLPLLKRYRELPTFYSRFEVDMRLVRFEKALRNLSRSSAEAENLERARQDDVTGQPFVGNEFQHCMLLIEEHRLYRPGLELFNSDEQQSQILMSLGNSLMQQKKPSLALSVFLSSKPIDYERCKTAARLCKDWRTYFQMILRADMDTDSLRQMMAAYDLSEELAADADGHVNRRELLTDAATIALQYGHDTGRAVDLLIQAEMWNEAQRIAMLDNKVDLSHRCVESAEHFARSTVSDLEERTNTFCTTMTRYSDALKIRKDTAGGEGEFAAEIDADDNGSLFSAASNMSNLSMTSTASNSSVASISSVISARSTTSFSIVGSEEATRHKSKYNERGGKKRDRGKKKKRGRAARVQPGSEEELEGLLRTLHSSCVDEQYRNVVEETITYLFRECKAGTARDLFDAYVAFFSKMKESQLAQSQEEAQDRASRTKQCQREGQAVLEGPVHPSEVEVHSLACPDLSTSIHELFALVPASNCGV